MLTGTTRSSRRHRRRARFGHDPQVWDADREWDLAFPELAYGVAQT
jgi:hypothetical protein